MRRERMVIGSHFSALSACKMLAEVSHQLDLIDISFRDHLPRGFFYSFEMRGSQNIEPAAAEGGTEGRSLLWRPALSLSARNGMAWNGMMFCIGKPTGILRGRAEERTESISVRGLFAVVSRNCRRRRRRRRLGRPFGVDIRSDSNAIFIDRQTIGQTAVAVGEA